MVYYFTKYIRLEKTLENKFNYDCKLAHFPWNKVLYLNVNIIRDYIKCHINIYLTFIRDVLEFPMCW